MKSNFTYLLLSTLFLSACGGTSAGGGGDSKFDQPSGSYSEEAAMDASDKSFQTVGCNHPAPQFDDRLKAGDVFINDFRFVSYNGVSITGRQQGELISVSKSDYSLKNTILSISGFPGAQPGMIENQKCHVDASGKKCESDATLNAPALEWCTVNNITTSEGPILSKGRFTLSGSGRILSAYRSTQKFVGTVTCNGKDFPGDMRTISIRSNEVKSLSPYFCGGDYVFNYFEVNVDKKNVSSGRFETINSP